jgi:hypothetical protein
MGLLSIETYRTLRFEGIASTARHGMRPQRAHVADDQGILRNTGTT